MTRSEYPMDDGNFMRASHGDRLEKLLLAILGNQATMMTALAREFSNERGRAELVDKAKEVMALLNQLYPSGRLQ